MTLDGTRTFLVGRDRVAIVDPGPADAAHLDAVVEAVGGADVVAILVTHRHPDHAAASAPLARRLGAPAFAAEAGTLADGDRFGTDAGALEAVATPGHTPDHVAFYWPAVQAVFAGDLFMGGEDTTLVAPPDGDLAAYLRSLDRVRALEPRTLHPAHGPDIPDPLDAIDRYVRHRRDRLDEVLDALADGPLTPDDVVDRVYGRELDPALRDAALGATTAYLRYLAERGGAHTDRGRWRLDR